jgi:phosphoribosylamine--glycine ligase
MASNGYPSHYEKGFEINIPESEKDYVYVAGASLKDGKLVTSGGRVLNVTGTGKDLKTAIDNAYERVSKISFDNAFYRKDIGKRALMAYTEDK